MAAELARLRQLIVATYSLEEFRLLCDDLKEPYDDLPGDGRPAKVNGLIQLLFRRGRLGELLAALESERPGALAKAGLLADATAFYSTPTNSDEVTGRYHRIRTNLIEKVRVIWLRGVLEQNLYEVARLELGLAERPGAVSRPWNMTLERPNQPDRPLPPGTNVLSIFRELGGAMLILGDPGAGKTITLLELARDLLDEAAKDTFRPVPLVFNLSSWAAQRRPLADWLAEELNIGYGVSKRFAAEWLSQENFYLLLDGLDEVAAEQRDACVAAINDYRQEHGFVPMVVCSRTAEYEQLSVKLSLLGAIVVQPLTMEQVDDYLAAGGEKLAGLRTAIQTDEILQELAQTPLLLNILALTYQGMDVGELAAGESPAEQRQKLFAAYVQRMFGRRGALEVTDQAQYTYWLSHLARQMAQREQTIFYIERLQANWLVEWWPWRFYWLTVVLVFGIGGELVGGMGGGLVGGLVDGLEGGLVGTLGGMLVGALVGWRYFGPSYIKLVEAVDFSWHRGVDGFWTDKPWLLGASLSAGLIYGLQHGPANGLVVGLGVGLAYGLTNAVGAAWVDQEAQVRAFPNQGIYLSALNSIRSGLVVGLAGSLTTGLLFGLYMVAVAGPVVGLVAGLVVGIFVGLVIGPLMSGGESVIKHTILRLLLAWFGFLPLRLTTFLEAMVGRTILRRAGGGYLFVHRLLLEYFAGLEDTLSPNPSPSKGEGSTGRASPTK